MRCIQWNPLAVIVVVTMCGFGGSAEGLEWDRYAERSNAWHQSREGRRAAENILSHQSVHGSWPKNQDNAAEEHSGEREEIRGTFDNGATFGEMRFLARAYEATGEESYREAFVKGLDHILEAQYPSGGWPQRFPPGDGYHRHITFNDGVMVNILELLQEVAESEAYGFVEDERREAARRGFESGIECMVESQIRVDGRRTAWCQQHDAETLQPRGGRSYEHPSISGAESAGILRLLMGLDDPGEGVIRAIHAGAAWYESAKIEGIRVVKRDGDTVVVEDEDGPPVWARFYEIGTGRPIFSGRDGVIKYELEEIERERRSGYAWYGSWGRGVASRYDRWKSEHDQDREGGGHGSE